MARTRPPASGAGLVRRIKKVWIGFGGFGHREWSFYFICRSHSNDAGFIDTRWVELEELYENCGKTPLKNALKKYRKAEEEDVDAAIADFEEGVEHEG